MNVREYITACTMIHEELAGIAERTRTLAEKSAPNAANRRLPEWDALMDRQDTLLKQLRELDATIDYQN